MSTPLTLVFAGTPDFAAQHLRALLATEHTIAAVYTQPDRPSGRGKRLAPSPVKQLATEAALPVYQPATLKSADAQAELRALKPDVVIVVAYGLILPQAVLDIPKFACINVHGSLLPRWRGAAPIQRAIEAGDPQSGVTIMAMEAGLDTGPMLVTRKIDLHGQETSGMLYQKLASAGQEALLEVLSDVPRYLAEATPQQDDEATYAHKIDKAEGLLNWSASAGELERRIRAFDPAPGCYTHLGPERLKVWQATVQKQPNTVPDTVLPGTIIAADDHTICVQCGEDALTITQAQFPGGKRQAMSELLKSRQERLSVGQLLQDEPA